MRELPELSAGVYRHWRGHHYLVLGYAQDSTNGVDDDMPFVVYVGLQLDGTPSPMRMRVRRAIEFFENVENVRGEWVPRFTCVGPSAW